MKTKLNKPKGKVFLKYFIYNIYICMYITYILIVVIFSLHVTLQALGIVVAPIYNECSVMCEDMYVLYARKMMRIYGITRYAVSTY